MVRPKIERRIVKQPDHTCLKHGDVLEDNQEAIKMNLDEFEAIRLGDYHNIKQKEAAELMGISQPTFHRIINSARKKTAISLIEGKKILLIDDSIVRGTQLRETTDFLYKSGAKEVHVRPACPPIMFGCKYLNFSRSKSEMDLIARRVVKQFEGDNVSEKVLKEYCDPNNPKYDAMLEEIRRQLNFTTLRYHRLDDMLDSTGLEHCKLCTYCWNGEE